MVVEPTKASISMLDSTREQDGLFGPVRRIHTEMSRVTSVAGKIVEEPRMLLEVTTYDPQGKRIWNVYYPVSSGSFKGNQEFAYDEQGHVKEMTLRDDAGRILSREAYSYDYDSFGNWTRMTSSLVIFEGGKIVYEPFEITSRAISYYFDESVEKIAKSPPSTTAPATSLPANEAKDSQTPIGSKTSYSVERDGTKPVATAVTPETSSSEKTTLTDPGNLDSKRNNEKQTRSDADVAAVSEVQAYQIPALPKTSSTNSKPTVSGGVVNGKIIHIPKPIYPPMALSRGLSGKVVVEVTLDEKGRVVGARALSGHPLLIPSAVVAAKMARFEPTLLSGQPVKATRLINFEFNGQ
jgi:TonB family protein